MTLSESLKAPVSPPHRFDAALTLTVQCGLLGVQLVQDAEGVPVLTVHIPQSIELI